MDPQEKLEEYVAQRIIGDARLDYIFSILSFFGGALLVLLTYYIAIVLIWLLGFLFSSTLLEGVTLRAIAGAFVALVFFESWRTSRKLFEEFEFEDDERGRALSEALFSLGFGPGMGTVPISATTAKNSVKAFADFFYSGPRLLRNSFKLLKRARERSSVDSIGCANILKILLESPVGVEIDEITESIFEDDLAPLIHQLSWLGGVLFIRGNPPKLSLADDLREKLNEVCFGGY